MRLLEGGIPPLQNEDWFLSSSYLQGTLHHYKMKTGFYMFLSSGYLKGTLQYYKMMNGNDCKGFSHVAFRRATSLATK
jgi:hypothetical protein